MIENEELLDAMGVASVAIAAVAYSIQIWKTYQGESEPHPIAWFGFGLLTGVGFAIQWQKGAAAGSWVMGFTAVSCFFVAAMSQYKRCWRLIDFDNWDWGALAAGAGLFVLYIFTRENSWGPYLSAILATCADLVLYIPIFKKAWNLPEKENATAYGLNSFKFVSSLFAMNSYSVETCLYPIAMIVINAIVVVYLIWRRTRAN